VYRTTQDLVNGRFKAGRSVVWNLRNGVVGLGRISPKVPRSFIRQMERIRAQIIAGEIKVPNSVK
jgi:basic membrane lipoprotein Med (substrate-binding protein (PBP1-ABC) superfamily)